MFKTITKEWNTHQLKRQLETTNAYFNDKITSSNSVEEARKYQREKIDTISTIATRYLNKNKQQ
jgi:hypothetical protein